eukprot:scaffold65106_cov32-Prasinocladus_malaysianus.AAC.1
MFNNAYYKSSKSYSWRLPIASLPALAFSRLQGLSRVLRACRGRELPISLVGPQSKQGRVIIREKEVVAAPG